jgi:hypothetical protein
MAFHSKRAVEGCLLIDHRDSPGTTVENCLATGIDPSASPLVPKGQMLETPTFSCKHCQRIVILDMHRRYLVSGKPVAYCPHCDHNVCDNPGCRLMASGLVPHKTMQQVFDELERSILEGMD